MEDPMKYDELEMWRAEMRKSEWQHQRTDSEGEKGPPEIYCNVSEELEPWPNTLFAENDSGGVKSLNRSIFILRNLHLS